jgi:hypothetical protein
MRPVGVEMRVPVDGASELGVVAALQLLGTPDQRLDLVLDDVVQLEAA